MHSVDLLKGNEMPPSPLYDSESAMSLDGYSGHSLSLPPPGYFNIHPSLPTPPESVAADDNKSETPESDSDTEFTPIVSSQIINRARDVLNAEARSLSTVAAMLNSDTFIPFIRIMHQCRGHIILTGIGKSALIAQKISATLASTGRPSFFLHSAEALHGDMGRITRRDVVIALSNSGEGPELSQIAKNLKSTTFRIDESCLDDEYVDSPFCGAKFLLITGNPRSSLSRYTDGILSIGEMEEACTFNVVPTNTTTAMLALGDALALCLFELLSGRRYSIKTFANFHPGGSLGKKLVRVQHVMSPCGSLVHTTRTLRDVIETLDANATGKHSTVVIVDSVYRFVRVFTDRDLRQMLLVRYPDGTGISLDTPIGQGLECCFPPSDYSACRLNQRMLVGDAHRMMENHGVCIGIVLDERQFPIGILHK